MLKFAIKQKNNKSKITISKIISIFALIWLITEFCLFVNQFGTGVLGYIIGEGIGYSLFMLLAVLFPCRWLKISLRAIVIPIVTLCFTYILCSYGLVIDFHLKKNAHLKKNLYQAIEDINEGKVLNDAQITEMDLGIFSDLVKARKDIDNQLQKIFLEYLQFSEEWGQKSLSPEILANSKLRNLYKEKLQDIKEKLNLSQKETINLINNFEENLQTDNIPVNQRIAFKLGVQQGVTFSKSCFDKGLELERLTLQTIEDIYEFLDQHEGLFYDFNNQLFFSRPEVLESYNGFIKTIEDIIFQRAMLGRKILNHQESMLKQFENEFL